MGPPVARLLDVLLQLHVDLHVVRVLLLEHLDLPPQVSQVLQLLLVRLDGRLVLANLGRVGERLRCCDRLRESDSLLAYLVGRLAKHVQFILELQGLVCQFLRTRW